MRSWRILLVGAALAAWPAAAAPQAPAAQAAPGAPEVMQRTFTFIGTQLRVTIVGGASGTIQVVRGELGQVGVATRSAGGLAVATLAPEAEPGELTLDSGTAARVDYVLVVPTSTYVSIQLPGHPAATLGAEEERGAWSWTGAGAPKVTPLPQD